MTLLLNDGTFEEIGGGNRVARRIATMANLRRKQAGRVIHATRNHPRRANELVDGGSIYWIIKGVMTARQRILDIVDVVRADGRPLVVLF